MQLSDLHAVNPYARFNAKPYPIDVHGWGSDAPIFDALVERIKPELILEIGTWKGASAIHMADVAKRLELPTKIVCIDTWLGSVEFWYDHTDVERYQSFNMKHGYQQVYYQFIANVVRAGHQDRIIPFPTTSLIAARWFSRQRAQADLIYIDGSHDYDDVLADMRAYWPLVRPGGMMFGDDFDVFRDVNKALEVFTKESGIRPVVTDRYWQVTK